MNVKQLGFRSSSGIRQVIEAIAKAHDVDIYQPKAKLVLNMSDEDHGDAMLECINLGDNRISVESFCETSYGSMEFPLTTFFIEKSENLMNPIKWYIVGCRPDYEEEVVFSTKEDAEDQTSNSYGADYIASEILLQGWDFRNWKDGKIMTTKER